jgi:hypothetical protein
MLADISAIVPRPRTSESALAERAGARGGGRAAAGRCAAAAAGPRAAGGRDALGAFATDARRIGIARTASGAAEKDALRRPHAFWPSDAMSHSGGLNHPSYSLAYIFINNY